MIKSHFDHKLLNPVSFSDNIRKHSMDTWSAMENFLEETQEEQQRRYHEWSSEKVYTIGRDEDNYLEEGCPD